LQVIRQNGFVLLAGLVYLILCFWFIWSDQAYLALFPLGLVAVYAAIYHTKWAFLALAFMTPLSVNIEEYTDSFGLFIPTEPLLAGFMLMVVLVSLRRELIEPAVWRHPIVLAVGFYLFWVGITAITSTHPSVSFKFLLARLWFIVPMLLFGTVVFRDEKNIRIFLWLFITGMVIAILYTLTVHAQYRFGEKEGHWVMWPFFKDHTIYGAIVALVTPLVFGLYLSKKHSVLVQAVLLGFIVVILLGLYFSYTRAAWLSVIAAMGVWFLIHFKIKFSLLAGIAIFAGSILFFSWDTIQMELARNKEEHTTENFAERLQSAGNVTTDASNLERLNRWSCAIEMFKERPVFGFGPGTYAFEYAPFQEPENLTIISTNFGDMGNAHSEYLGPMAEMGAIGLLAVLLLVAAIFYKGINLYIQWPTEDRETRVLILAMILSLTTYFVHGVLNNYLDTDKAAVPIWAMSAMFIALEMKLKQKGNFLK
jgi:putative inorganic carbon (hco3(-)) transporter